MFWTCCYSQYLYLWVIRFFVNDTAVVIFITLLWLMVFETFLTNESFTGPTKSCNVSISHTALANIIWWLLSSIFKVFEVCWSPISMITSMVSGASLLLLPTLPFFRRHDVFISCNYRYTRNCQERGKIMINCKIASALIKVVFAHHIHIWRKNSRGKSPINIFVQRNNQQTCTAELICIRYWNNIILIRGDPCQFKVYGYKIYY